jgi:hypothetical protein
LPETDRLTERRPMRTNQALVDVWLRDALDRAATQRRLAGRDASGSALTTQSRNRRNRKAKLDLVRAAKEPGCVVCPERRLACIDLHHLDPELKAFSVAKVTEHGLEEVRAEIAKCVPLCANCHRLFHAGEVNLPKTTV